MAAVQVADEHLVEVGNRVRRAKAELNMITCKDIKKVYRNGEMETHALRGVSFSVEKGEFVAIMGPSGSGKSTLMHTLGCLDTPSSGVYSLDGVDVIAQDDDELANIRRDKIGFVFQSFNLLPRATVMRNVMLPLVYADVPDEKREERVKEALRAAAFPEQFWGHYSNQLSGGMMQRVAIARALVSNPAIILADEPTGNLDSATGNFIMETFQRLHKEEGRTIILITHELEIAEHAERIISLRDGVISSDIKLPKEKRRIIHNGVNTKHHENR